MRSTAPFKSTLAALRRIVRLAMQISITLSVGLVCGDLDLRSHTEFEGNGVVLPWSYLLHSNIFIILWIIITHLDRDSAQLDLLHLLDTARTVPHAPEQCLGEFRTKISEFVTPRKPPGTQDPHICHPNESISFFM